MSVGPSKTVRHLGLASLAALAALLTTLPLFAALVEKDWRFYKQAELPDHIAEPGLVEMELDSEVYAHASPDLRDIRIVGQQEGREEPYKLLLEAGDQRRASVAANMRDLGHAAGQHTSFVLDLQSDGTLHNELEVQTSSDNFQRRVAIEGSDDGETWRTLRSDSVIFDLTVAERGFTAKETRVTYPDSTARFLRVRITDDGLEPLSIHGGVAFFARRLEPQRATRPLVIVGRKDDPERKETVLQLDGGSTGYPVNSIELDVPQRNFHRQVSLEGSDDLTSWRIVQGSETLYDFDTPKFVGNDLSIGFGESRYRYYQVTIANEDNPPLPVEGARASGFVRKLVFSADPTQSYRLYYGNPNVSAPSYDLERIFPYLVTEGLPVATLGTHTQNPAFAVPAPPPQPFSERHPWLLPAIVAIAALLIGVFLASLVRQLKGTLPPPRAPR